MYTYDGLEEQLESLEDRLIEAENEGDEDKVLYLKDQIEKTEKWIQGKKDYDSIFNK